MQAGAGRQRRPRTKHDLRCLCKKQPLLAVYGIDEKGQLYIHQKIFKQGRVFGESFFYGGTVTLLCRECYRWNRVVMVNPQRAALSPTEMPEALRLEMSRGESLPDDQPHS